MLTLEKLRQLAEAGYSSSLENNEVISKQFFWDILRVLNEASAQKASEITNHYSRVPDRKKMLIVAYYLSEYGHETLFQGTYISQQDAIKKAAEILHIKANTLKNQRDFFDTHTNSHREGWKKDLDSHQQAIFDEMRNLSQDEALNKVRTILKL